MSISVTCECGRHFETADAHAGRRARCPICGHELTVPQPAPPPEVVFITDISLPTRTSSKAIASLALGALFFFACASGVPAVLLGWHALSDIKKCGGRLRGRKMAIAGIVLGLIGCLFTLALLLPLYRSAGAAAWRAQCTNNLKQIGLAMQIYEQANACLPSAAIVDKKGRPLLSWRVAILPYIEMSALYAKFHLDEPWDSPHNLSLLEPTPFVYACPADKTLKPGMTGYQVVISPNTAFTPDFKPLRVLEFTDGLDRTLIVSESRHFVPWTKPEDLPFDMSVPLSGLGSYHGHHDNGFNVLLGDGSVRFFKRSVDPKTLETFLIRNGAVTDGGSY
jgi:prepilin-type processing-associated H-X9-DG protein